MLHELNKLFSGRSGRLTLAVVFLSLAYVTALDILRNPQSVSWIIMKGMGTVFFVFFAIRYLWPRSKDVWNRFDSKYGSYISLVLVIGFFAWGYYLVTTGSGRDVFLVVSFGLGVLSLLEFLWIRFVKDNASQTS